MAPLQGSQASGELALLLKHQAQIDVRLGIVGFEVDGLAQGDHRLAQCVAGRQVEGDGDGLGLTPEDRRIFVDLTVMENLDIGRQPPRAFLDGRPAPSWTPEKLFSLFPNLGEMRNRPGGRMSGGEQQMLTIARTLMGNPSLVLLDEPSEGLSPKIVEQMVDAILAMKREGVSIVVSEQNLHFARLISDRAYIIERGKICFGGTMAELDARPDIRDAHLSL